MTSTPDSDSQGAQTEYVVEAAGGDIHAEVSASDREDAKETLIETVADPMLSKSDTGIATFQTKVGEATLTISINEDDIVAYPAEEE